MCSAACLIQFRGNGKTETVFLFCKMAACKRNSYKHLQQKKTENYIYTKGLCGTDSTGILPMIMHPQMLELYMQLLFGTTEINLCHFAKSNWLVQCSHYFHWWLTQQTHREKLVAETAAAATTGWNAQIHIKLSSRDSHHSWILRCLKGLSSI